MIIIIACRNNYNYFFKSHNYKEKEIVPSTMEKEKELQQVIMTFNILHVCFIFTHSHKSYRKSMVGQMKKKKRRTIVLEDFQHKMKEAIISGKL